MPVTGVPNLEALLLGLLEDPPQILVQGFTPSVELLLIRYYDTVNMLPNNYTDRINALRSESSWISIAVQTASAISTATPSSSMSWSASTHPDYDRQQEVEHRSGCSSLDAAAFRRVAAQVRALDVRAHVGAAGGQRHDMIETGGLRIGPLQ